MRTVLALVVAFTTLSVAACNTIGGMAQDTSTAGRDISKVANAGE